MDQLTPPALRTPYPPGERTGVAAAEPEPAIRAPSSGPSVRKIRGLPLVVLWLLLTGLAWVLALGAGYGLYLLAGLLF